MISLRFVVDFANNPSHWDGNPGIRIVNPYSPKQFQLKAEASIQWTRAKNTYTHYPYRCPRRCGWGERVVKGLTFVGWLKAALIVDSRAECFPHDFFI